MWEGDLSSHGWTILRQSRAIGAWVEKARPAALAALEEPAHQSWYRCEGTWFAGVDCLPNDEAGAVAGSGPFPFDLLKPNISRLPLHHGQVSAVFPGYPTAMAGESPAAADYRRKRCAAHIDGLLPVGPDRRRMLREPHAWILGLPMTASAPGASPLVMWEGSHHIMRRAFDTAFAGMAEEDRYNQDVTKIYQNARREVFKGCKMRILHAGPGDAILLHRMAVHGIVPWSGAQTSPRVIVYFRPQISISDWLIAG